MGPDRPNKNYLSPQHLFLLFFFNNSCSRSTPDHPHLVADGIQSRLLRIHLPGYVWRNWIQLDQASSSANSAFRISSLNFIRGGSALIKSASSCFINFLFCVVLRFQDFLKSVVRNTNVLWRQSIMLRVFTFLGCFIFDVQDTPQVEWQCAHCCHLSLMCSDLVMTAGCCLVSPSLFYLCDRCSHLTTDSLRTTQILKPSNFLRRILFIDKLPLSSF